MLVSVIVPTRNRAHLLPRALAGIAMQTHAQTEIVVVDDGSSPEDAAANLKTLNAVAPSTGRYIYLPGHHPHGSGPSYARNVGIMSSTGDLVAFLDDDDEWCGTQWLAETVAAFGNDANIDLIFANQAMSKDQAIVQEVWLPDLVLRLALGAGEAAREVTKSDCLIPTGDFPALNICIVRRSLCEQIGGFWEGVRFSEDRDFFVRAVDVARKIVYRPDTVAIHHIPDRTLGVSASARPSDIDKRLAEVSVANHLLATCADPITHRFARALAGDAYRRLARFACEQAAFADAFGWAKLAQAFKPTFRWGVFLNYLRLRALGSRRRAADQRIR